MCMMCELGYGPDQEAAFGKIGLQNSGLQVDLGAAAALQVAVADLATRDESTPASVGSGGSADASDASALPADEGSGQASTNAETGIDNASETWWVNDQTPANPFGKSDDYEAYLDYLGALPRSLTPDIAAEPLRINLSELSNHPDYQDAAVGALEMWASVTPFEFEIVDDAPYDENTDWMEVVSPEIGERFDGSAFSSDRYISVGQRFHDSEPNLTDIGGYVFDTFIHEYGHEFGLNHPGLYNYSGPGGVQINYLNNATWIYDRQQYSVMSYFDGIDVGQDTRWSAATPLMGDIEAVIRTYFSTVDEDGARTYQTINLNTGDDVYGFNSTKYGYELTSSGMTRDIGFVIHDTGGTDTIDFSGSIAGTILDMRAGQFSSVNGHNNNVSIFAGHNEDETEYYIETGIGSQYDDILIGNDGDNVLDGRSGGDRMAGGDGDDTYFVDSLHDIVREEAGGGNDTVIVMSRGLDIGGIANVENIIYVDGTIAEREEDGGETPPSSGDNTLTSIIFGDETDETIEGGAGDNTIFGLGGDDIIIGGTDSLASRDINNTIDIADLEDQTESDDGNDALYGGDGNDTILGGQGDDLLDGGDGDDMMSGQAGVDVFRGGAGHDTVDYSRESPFQLIVNLETNFANGGTASGDTFYDIEGLIGSDDRIDRFIGTSADNHFMGQGGGDVFNGRDGNDTLDGGRDGDILYGEGGDDMIIGGAGQDYLDGGEGTDTVVYRDSSSGVTVDLANGRATGGDADGPVQIVGRGTAIRHDILVGFENVEGSFYDDWLIGDDQINELSAGHGDDTLTGGGGGDMLDGGAGSDTADYSDATSGVRLNLRRDASEGDSFVSIENLSGSGFDDRLIGDNAANVLTGQGGDDTLRGGGGDDTLLGDFAYQGDTLPTPGMGTGYVTLGPDATNNSIATAFDISDNFSLEEDPDIFDSTTVLHTTVEATGNGQGGYYSIDLAAGTILSIDVDGIADPNVHDSWIRLLDSNGDIVAENDDGGGDPGSTSIRDSSTVHVVEETGTYYILQGSWTAESEEGGWTEAVPEGSTYRLNVSVDLPPAPAEPGEAGADVLSGGRGSDLLDGGLEADTLFGGMGEDSFRFSTELGEGNIDLIRDFDVTEDLILLDSLIFEDLGDGRALSFGAFHSSVAGVARDSDDRILYSTDDGALSYDADGSGDGDAIQFAQLSGSLDLSADNFIII
ncbi:M10 family metallopeptidase C-terminal domain-containing protein [Roseobacter sinensis]|uniref:M10 family metallopeptidase C-terminal domain-containing protein n=1 Tax=Roseobacter sinensis TaxID=2931391 RepID=A0ABT3BKT3_9RHOB|nr:M10 family metallopeptidase C-terminal domain-containing protein [Roseobacter sp. WL0113]MCV3274176.1 M10 family metallopeptidase C-terminal domain-containing protein [Roseobacter sp. WL0113]